MSIYHIGNFIKQRREELKITQEELAEGLCSLPTLSRLENGSQTPHGNTLKALLHRLGYSDTLMFQTAGKEEFEIAKLQVKIIHLYNSRDFDGAREAFDELNSYREFFYVTDRQFYEIMYTIFYENEFTNDEILTKLENALRLTHPEYSVNNLPKILTYEESTALNRIAVILDSLGKRKEAIRVLYHLKNFYERNVVDKLETLRALPTIMYNLSKFLGLSGRYDECIEVCNQAIRLAKESARSRLLSKTLYNLSWVLVKRGRSYDMEYAKHVVKEAYYLSLILENRPDFLGRLRKFIKENFDEDMPSII